MRVMSGDAKMPSERRSRLRVGVRLSGSDLCASTSNTHLGSSTNPVLINLAFVFLLLLLSCFPLGSSQPLTAQYVCYTEIQEVFGPQITAPPLGTFFSLDRPTASYKYDS